MAFRRPPPRALPACQSMRDASSLASHLGEDSLAVVDPLMRLALGITTLSSVPGRRPNSHHTCPTGSAAQEIVPQKSSASSEGRAIYSEAREYLTPTPLGSRRPALTTPICQICISDCPAGVSVIPLLNPILTRFTGRPDVRLGCAPTGLVALSDNGAFFFERHRCGLFFLG